MHEDEPPRERRPVLDFSDDRLGDEGGHERGPERQQTGVATPHAHEEPPDEEHAQPERRCHPDVDVHGVDDLEAESLHVLVRSWVRARRCRDRAGDDQRSARWKPDPGDEATKPTRPGGGGESAVVAPRLERDHDREREHREREQEVRHHRERVQVERDRDGAHRDLRDGQQERGERRESHATRKADDPARAEPGDERQRQTDEGDDAVPELDERVESLLRVGLVAALRPVVASETGSGQPHEGPRCDHEEEGRAGGEREPQEPTRRERADACDRGDHYSSTTPAPVSTDPMRVIASPAAANVASSAAPCSRGRETSRPPAVCGSYASASSAASTSLATCGPA